MHTSTGTPVQAATASLLLPGDEAALKIPDTHQVKLVEIGNETTAYFSSTTFLMFSGRTALGEVISWIPREALVAGLMRTGKSFGS